MTVIRDAVIRIRTETVKGRADTPESGPAERAYKAEARAATEARQAVEKLGESTRLTGVKAVAAFREGGEGALRFARGLAFLSASGSEDLRRLVQVVSVAQGAFDVFAGGFKAITNISAALGGPVTAAVVGLTAAVSAGALAWFKWGEEAAKGAQRAERAIASLASAEERRERQQAELAAGRIGAALDPQERARRIQAELGRLGDAAREDDASLRRRERDIQAAAIGLGPAPRGTNAEYLSLIRQQAENAKSQAMLTRDLYELQTQQIAVERNALSQLSTIGVTGAAGIGLPGLAGIAAQTTANAAGTTISRLDEQAKQLLQSTQATLTKLAELISTFSVKLDAIENGSTTNAALSGSF